jgi:hypothetical protein
MRHRLARSLGTLAMEMPLPDVEKRAASSPPPAVADRDHVYAGPRAEEVASLAAGITKAKSRLDYEQQQLTRAFQLARSDTAAQQSLETRRRTTSRSALADVTEAEANHAAAVAGPTQEE